MLMRAMNKKETCWEDVVIAYMMNNYDGSYKRLRDKENFWYFVYGRKEYLSREIAQKALAVYDDEILFHSIFRQVLIRGYGIDELFEYIVDMREPLPCTDPDGIRFELAKWLSKKMASFQENYTVEEIAESIRGIEKTYAAVV